MVLRYTGIGAMHLTVHIIHRIHSTGVQDINTFMRQSTSAELSDQTMHQID